MLDDRNTKRNKGGQPSVQIDAELGDLASFPGPVQFPASVKAVQEFKARFEQRLDVIEDWFKAFSARLPECADCQSIRQIISRQNNREGDPIGTVNQLNVNGLRHLENVPLAFHSADVEQTRGMAAMDKLSKHSLTALAGLLKEVGMGDCFPPELRERAGLPQEDSNAETEDPLSEFQERPLFRDVIHYPDGERFEYYARDAKAILDFTFKSGLQLVIPRLMIYSREKGVYRLFLSSQRNEVEISYLRDLYPEDIKALLNKPACCTLRPGGMTLNDQDLKIELERVSPEDPLCCVESDGFKYKVKSSKYIRPIIEADITLANKLLDSFNPWLSQLCAGILSEDSGPFPQEWL